MIACQSLCALDCAVCISRGQQSAPVVVVTCSFPEDTAYILNTMASKSIYVPVGR